MDDRDREPSVWIFLITLSAALVVAGFYILDGS